MNTRKVLCTIIGYKLKIEEQLYRLAIANYLSNVKMIKQWSDTKKIDTSIAFS